MVNPTADPKSKAQFGLMRYHETMDAMPGIDPK